MVCMNYLKSMNQTVLNEATKVGRKRGEKNTHEAECLP